MEEQPASNHSALCIAGAHRSGTSMVTQLLHTCGLHLGSESDWLQPRSDNPEGFWENLHFVAINDEVLNQLGGAWDLPPPANTDFKGSALESLRRHARRQLARLASTTPWGWKDPRNCLTLRFWQELVPQLKVLLVVRNPLEVASSMRKRNGTSYPFGLRLWETYNRWLLDACPSEKLLVTHYDSFFLNADKELHRIAHFADLPTSGIEAAVSVVSAIKRHTRFSIEQLIDARVALPIVELYQKLIIQSREHTSARIESTLPAQMLPGTASYLDTSIPDNQDWATLRALLQATQRESVQLRTENERQRKENTITLQELERKSREQINQLKTENARQLQALSEERNALTKLRTQSQQENEILNNRLSVLEQTFKDFSSSFALNKRSVKQADSLPSALIRSVSRDIRRVSRRAVFWKMRKTIGIKTDTINPKTIVLELKQDLRRIQRVLESKESSAPAVIAALTALACLRRRAAMADSRFVGMSSRVRRAIQILFDQAWYTRTYPAAAITPMSPLQYYLTFGVLERNNPHPLFDVEWYLGQQPCLKDLKTSPLEHYIAQGPGETRSPHQLFDAAFYVTQHPDVPEGELPPLAHYLRIGWKLGYRPNRYFDPQFYLQTYPDIGEAGIEPLTHFVLWGQARGRSPSVLFDPGWYKRTYLADAKNTVPPLQHYITTGAKAGYNPHPLFDVSWYLNQSPRLANLETNPLDHYLAQPAGETRSPHPEFDAAFYVAQYPDSLKSELPPLVHYLTIGWKLGYHPSPDFDPQFYLQSYSDVAKARLEPLTHFIVWGKPAGRFASREDVPFRLVEPEFEISRAPLPSGSVIKPRARAVAFYLPQYHAIPENDRWWGRGFTDWNNVRSAKPNYSAHYQPHVPTGLGYYDLSKPEALERQAELARTYGLSGFCFYHYWFGGHVLLDLPLRTMLETGQPDFPFCLCWANENWTRRWDGREDEILIAQSHSGQDDLKFIQHIERVLLHHNYIRVEGKPILLVYRPALLPNPVETTYRWREYFRSRGHGELQLVMVRSFHEKADPETYGFDAAVQFPPHFAASSVEPWIPERHPDFTGDVRDYIELRKLALEELERAPTRIYPGVIPSWDNTARRRRNAHVWVNSSPEAYYEWLAAATDYALNAQGSEKSLLFINAWNEWAEGCHLEPDEKYGYAWLNATALALDVSRQIIPKTAASYSAKTAPEPPLLQEVEVPPIPPQVKLAISVLFYHREDLINPFLESILPQIIAAEATGVIRCSLYLAFNYRPSEETIQDVTRLTDQILGRRRDNVTILQHGFNLGFGAGHTFTFARTDCDVFLILNSDVRISNRDWLITLVDRFRSSDEAIIGATETASRLREDGCGIPVGAAPEQFDFVDGSVMAIRTDLARRFGLFSPSFNYFYFEDADLCLRYRQIGLKIGLLDLPYEHERSSSSRLLPQFAMEEVLNRNRARFFDRWDNYLQTHTLPNRIGINFSTADRQLQCASLPAIFSLLSEHRTAVIDIRGVHAQLLSLFQHERLRLIPSWQELRPGDYLRFYKLDFSRSEIALPYDMAHRMGCDPDFEGARQHLTSLVNSTSDGNSKRALFYLDRKSPGFEGKQPPVDSLLAAARTLQEDGYEIHLLTNYGDFEVQHGEMSGWRHIALLPAIDVLKEIASADLIVTSDNWISELSQLLTRRTFIWLGAIAQSGAISAPEHVSSFTDSSLNCLGCYHQFGRKHRNVCLRGDVACMRACLAVEFSVSLTRFIEGSEPKSQQVPSSGRQLAEQRVVRSDHLSLKDWSRSLPDSVLILTPVHPNIDQNVLARARELASRAVKGLAQHRIIYDEFDKAPLRGVPHAMRQTAMSALRQRMLETHLSNEQWVFWADADIVDYPANLIEELILRAEGGIAAPLVLMEGSASDPARPDGFGPGRFYDVAGFSAKGRWAQFTPPYFDQPGPVYQLDSVGSCYLVNADLYRQGAAHTVDPASRSFLNENKAWPKDAVSMSQHGPPLAYTEHYTVCQFALEHKLPVQAFADLVAYHERV